MDCLKCGKKIDDGQNFCAHCLESMEAYPVKPDVHVQIPNRPVASLLKKPRRRALSSDELVPILRKKLRRAKLVVVVLILLLGLSVAAHLLVEPTPETSDTGKNYTFINPFG